MPVNRERVTLLTAALRSGNYEKGTGKLHTITTENGVEHHGWCCLGVASDVAVKHGVTGVTRINTYYAGKEVEGFNGNISYMCREVMNFYGFEVDNPALVTPPGYLDDSAASLNDSGLVDRETGMVTEVSLADIAGFFEATYLTAETETTE